MLKKCPICALDTANICPRYTQYTQDIPKIRPRYPQVMPKICIRYAQDMPKIRLRYAQIMPEICRWYARDMPKRECRPANIILFFFCVVPSVCFFSADFLGTFNFLLLATNIFILGSQVSDQWSAHSWTCLQTFPVRGERPPRRGQHEQHFRLES